MSACARVQHAATETTRIVLYCGGFASLKEDIKNTWFVKLEIKIVQVT
jgi:hypothetical protein